MSEEDARIILASASSIRREMLEAAGIEIEVVPASIDERALREHLTSEGAGVSEIAMALAEYKALVVSRDNPDRIVIGADQLLVLGHQIFEKPGSIEDAQNALLQLRGQTHELVSAAAVMQDGDCYWRGADSARLTMRDFSPEFLDDYLSREGEAVLSSVGAYRLEGYGVNLFSAIEGNYFTILGLPLMGLLAMLREAEVLPS